MKQPSFGIRWREWKLSGCVWKAPSIPSVMRDMYFAGRDKHLQVFHHLSFHRACPLPFFSLPLLSFQKTRQRSWTTGLAAVRNLHRKPSCLKLFRESSGYFLARCNKLQKKPLNSQIECIITVVQSIPSMLSTFNAEREYIG